MLGSQIRPPARSIAVALVWVAVTAAALLGLAPLPLPAASAADEPIASVTGRAFGYHSDDISLFDGPQKDTGPIPLAALAPDASNSPQSAAAAAGRVVYGPANLFTSDDIELSTTGNLGATGSVTTTSKIKNINSASSHPEHTGSEIFGYFPDDPHERRTALEGTCTASPSGVSGTTMVTHGMVRTHAQGTDYPSSGGHSHDPNNNPEGEVPIPAEPPPNYKVAGHVHLDSTTSTDYFVIVFNEQITNPDGSLTVNPVHEYFGAKLNQAGDIVEDPPYFEGGSILHGHLYLGQVRCGVSTAPPPPPNAPPEPVGDAYTIDEDTTLSVAAPGLLGNDVDPDGDPLTAAVATEPANGTVVVASDGSFDYTPDPDFPLGPIDWRKDFFTYSASDGKDVTTARVEITVRQVNDYPRAMDDSYRTFPDVPLRVPPPGVLANDYDPDAFNFDPGNPELTIPPQHGTLSFGREGDGGFVYVPNLGFTGVDGFTYALYEDLSQPQQDRDTAQVAIAVTDNVPPDAVDDAYTIDEETPLTVAAPGVLANDTDGDVLDAGNLEAALATGPAHGTVSLNQDGSFAYTPAADFAGTDTFTYTATDPRGTSDTATVRVTVNGVNDAPDAVDDSYATNEDSQLTVGPPGLLGNDSDPDGDALVAAVAAAPAHGDVFVGPDGSLGYGPAPNYSGPDSFTYTVSDGNGGTDTATVTVTVAAVNDAPSVGNDSYTTVEESPLTVAAPGVLGNDGDADGDALSAGSAGTPAHGSVTLGADGSFTYTPAVDYTGVDTFTYVAADGNGGTTTGTVSVTIAGVNDAPSAGDDNYGTTEATPLTLAAPGVLGNDSDPDGDALSAGSASDPDHGSVTLNVDGSFTYTPDAGFTGTDTFTYTASDPAGATDIATVRMTVAPGGDTRPTQLSVADMSLVEGDSGATTATFTVTRSGSTTGASTVKYKTSGGTASAGTDYTAVSTLTTLSFAAGETSKTVTVNVAGDTLPEANETFKLALSAPTGAVVADASGTATIHNDDGAAYLAVENLTVLEANADTSATFRITRSGNTTGSSSAKYKTANGTAGVDDFTAIGLTPVTFAPGETSKDVSVTIKGDALDEKNETFTLALSTPVGATIADTAGTATIVDDEGTVTAGPATFLSVDSLLVNEGNTATTPAVFIVTRTGDTTVASTVKYRTSGGTATAGADYTAITTLGTLSFAAGETSKTVTVDVIGDGLPEGDETFNLTLSAATGAVLADTAGTATIVNDDGSAYVGVDDISVVEGDSGTTTATFTLTRSGNTTGASTVSYQTKTGTAGTADFGAVSLTSVTFAPGETTKTVTVAVTGETLDEASEKFTLALSAPVGATISDAAGAATIVDDD